jgi:hypothetical protein
MYAKFGLRTLIGNPPSYSSYSCGSNVNVICEYIQGDITAVSIDDETWFMGWDRINIILDGTALASPFHIIVPDLYTRDGSVKSRSTLYKYAVGIGAYNQKSRTYR